MNDKISTKFCAQCASTVLCLLASLHVKICMDCKFENPWEIEPGQRPLMGSSRGLWPEGATHEDLQDGLNNETLHWPEETPANANDDDDLTDEEKHHGTDRQ